MKLTLSDAERLAVSESLWAANVPFNARLAGDLAARGVQLVTVAADAAKG